MKKSIRQKVSKSKRVVISGLRKSCLEIYKRLYIIKSIRYVAQLKGGNQVILNCECKKHKICFSTSRSKFLNANHNENRVSCTFCRKEKDNEKYDIKYYQNLVDKNKGKNVAIVKNMLNNRLIMKCLTHEIEYDQSVEGLKRCGCSQCFILTPRNSVVTLAQVNIDIRKWGESIIALKILGNHNKLTGEVKSILYKCTKNGHEGDIVKPLQNRLFSHPCNKCSIEAKSMTYSQMVENALVIHPIGYTYAKTRDVYTSIDEVHFKCPTCSSDNVKSFRSHFYKKRGCENCIRKLNGINQIKSDEEILKSLKQIGKTHFRFTGNTKHDAAGKNLMRQLVCEKHDVDFYTYITKSYLKHIGCGICNCESKMERHIREYLKMNYIEFQEQKRFKDCVNINQLPFDFYIPSVPSTKKSLLIEYDGGQHHIPIYGQEVLKQQVKRDTIKTNYANSIGIELLRIPYTKDHEIISILNKVLFNIN